MKTIVGIDWSEKKHCVHIYSEAGVLVSRLEVAHTVAGFARLEAALAAVNPVPADILIAIETSHNLLVDYLQDQGYTLYVLAPTVVASNRGRQGSSGAKDDDRDAALLADILRTDQGRLLPWQADGPLVRQLRVLLSSIDDLTQSLVATHNRLRANLLRYYLQPLRAFGRLTGVVALNFLVSYATPRALPGLSLEQFIAFCAEHRYHQRERIAAIWAKLQAAAPTLDAAVVPVYQRQTVFLAQQALTLKRQKEADLAAVQVHFTAHPDAPIFASVPGAGDLLAPKLLVMFGDHRDRYPQRDILPRIAGTAPVTIASGKSRVVRFRRACNRSYRQTAQQLAQASVRTSSWAAAYYQRALDRGLQPSHAYRCLANRWLHIIWALWQKRQPFDPAYHQRQVARHRRPLPGARQR